MSGQSKRSRGRTLRRWRGQVVRMLYGCAAVRIAKHTGTPGESALVFDVAHARDHAYRIVALGRNAIGWAELAEHRGRPLAAAWLRSNALRLHKRVKTAQHLLDTLEGRCPWAPSARPQFNECPECGGACPCCGASPTLPHNMSCAPAWQCRDCRGAGRNVRGMLPSIEGRAERRLRTAQAKR
jgi:hypothetical protein